MMKDQPRKEGPYFDGTMSYLCYQEYLQSDEWKYKRDMMIRLRNYECELCHRSPSDLHVHHKTYENVCNERVRDLMVVCRKCHEHLHSKR
jgi:5-methylcytosine-specific restriction endonuclease McrA